jgi:hypothetical protein
MKIKKNVNQFDRDVENGGRYQYTGAKLSSILANKRMSDSVKTMLSMKSNHSISTKFKSGYWTPDIRKSNINTSTSFPSFAQTGLQISLISSHLLSKKFQFFEIYYAVKS